jgi:L-threonylcarbamoyladenylate synthase
VRTLVLSAWAPNSLRRAIDVLRGGGLVAFPTDTVYGLGALAFDDVAVKSIYTAKQRPGEKALPVLVGQTSDLERVASTIPAVARRLSSVFWPGPLTLVVPKNSDLPLSVAPGATVGIREPNHAAALELLREAGPMAVSSANISGLPSPRTAADVLRQLGERVALVLDGGLTPGGIPSTVLDCTQAKPVVLRAGPVTAAQIEAALG